MRILQVVILSLMCNLAVTAQEFIPLRIDSSYSFFRSLDFFGNPIEIASFAGYSYDTEGALLQIRRENERSNFTFLNMQKVELVEIFTNGLWENAKRITTTFESDQPVEIFTEVFLNNFWENEQLEILNYNDNDQLIDQITQIWIDNEWVNREKVENTFDDMGNRILQSYFNANQDGDFVFTFGDRIKYNNNNQPTEILSLTGNNGGVFFSDKMIVSYNDDQQQDTVIFCLYTFPDTVNCENLSRSVFTYDLQENRIIRDIDSWINNDWESNSRVEEYVGRNIYSSLPDSILTFNFNLSTEDQLITRQYFNYIEVNEEEVRYEESLFLYQIDMYQFVLENFREEFFQKESIVSNDNLIEINQPILFPNPISSNELLTIKDLNLEFTNLEIYIFDLTGRLINQERSTGDFQFTAPNTPGIYFIKIENEDQPVLMQKLIVH